MERRQKEETYWRVTREIKATLEGETDLIASMATIACLLHHSFDYFFWTGFYRVVAPGELLKGSPLPLLDDSNTIEVPSHHGLGKDRSGLG